MTQKRSLPLNIKLLSGSLLQLAKTLIIFEIALGLAFAAYFTVNFFNKAKSEASSATSILQSEGEDDCFVQIIEGRVFKLCQPD